jgi:hypothetical protein
MHYLYVVKPNVVVSVALTPSHHHPVCVKQINGLAEPWWLLCGVIRIQTFRVTCILLVCYCSLVLGPAMICTLGFVADDFANRQCGAGCEQTRSCAVACLPGLKQQSVSSKLKAALKVEPVQRT